MNPKPTYEELAHCVQALEKEVERHKRLEGALNLRKRQFSDSQKLAHVGSWTWEISMGEVYWFKEVYCIFGIEPDNFRPDIDSVMRRFHPDDRRVHEQVMAQVIEDPKIYDFEARILLPDGSERFILFTSEGLHDDQDTLIEIIGTVQEITNRTHIVAALRESEGRFRLAF